MTAPYYFDDLVTLHLGDCLEVLAGIPDASVDAVVTDPPYGLAELSAATVLSAVAAWMSGDRSHVPDGQGFMGREWDRFVPPPAAWDECMRVLKPGGHLLSFAGSRTVDLMTLSIRIAGFEIRDSIAWLYGSGWPKSKGCLKPAHEPIVVARKPLTGTVAANVAAYGTGALNIDGCRVSPGELVRCGGNGSGNVGGIMGPKTGSRPRVEPHDSGRWPPNVLLSGEAAAELDRQSGTLTSGANPARRSPDKFRDAYGEFAGQAESTVHRGADSGGASRFFPVFRYQAKAPASERPRLEDGTAHCTVKPLELLRFLVRLVTPPGGLVLDPFAGSGTTGQACALEGFRCVLAEKDPKSAELARVRLSKPVQTEMPLTGEAAK